MMRRTITGGALLAAIMISPCSAQPHPADGAHQMNAAHHGEGAQHPAPHIKSMRSEADFATTLAQIKTAIEARGFKTFAVIDHAAGAASVDMALRPTTLIIFGNPKGGAPVMAAEQLMGIELPLKMLVAEAEDGSVALVWRDMAHSFHEYGIPDHPAAEKMAGALSAIAEEAGQASRP